MENCGFGNDQRLTDSHIGNARILAIEHATETKKTQLR